MAHRGPGQDATRLSIVGGHEHLDDLGAWIEGIATHERLSRRTRFQLELVLTEAVTNVMDYARRAQGACRIDLACSVDADEINVEIVDDGPAFDPTARAEAEPPRSLEEARPGGLGIQLMRRYTSRMEYLRSDGRNALRLTLPNEPAADAG